MKQTLFVDAYNYILSLKDRETIEKYDLWEQARQSLHWRMQRYHRVTGHQVILVYDNKTSYASLLYAQSPPIKETGVSIQFTHPPQEADAWILRMIPRFLADGRSIRVISNDQGLLNKAVQLGAEPVRIDAFRAEENELEDADRAKHERLQWLISTVSRVSGEERLRHVEELSQLGYPDISAELFLMLLTDEDPIIRWHACAALARIDPEHYKDELMLALQDPDPRVTRQALEGLRKVKSHEVQQRILTILRQEPIPEIEDALVSSLLVTDDESSLSVLFRLAGHSGRTRLASRLIELVRTAPTGSRLLALLQASAENSSQRAQEIYLEMLDNLLTPATLLPAISHIGEVQGPARAVIRKHFLRLGRDQVWSMLERLSGAGQIHETHLQFLLSCPSTEVTSFLSKWKGRVTDPDLRRRLALFFVEQHSRADKLYVLDALPLLPTDQWPSAVGFILSQGITTTESADVLRIIANFPSEALGVVIPLVAKIVLEQEILFFEEILSGFVSRLQGEDIDHFFGLLSSIRQEIGIEPFVRTFDQMTSDAQVGVVKYLGYKTSPDTIMFLQKQLSSDFREVRLQAALGLFNLQPDLGYPAVEVEIAEADDAVGREIAQRIFPRISDDQAARILTKISVPSAEFLSRLPEVFGETRLAGILFKHWAAFSPQMKSIATPWIESHVDLLTDEDLRRVAADQIPLFPQRIQIRIDESYMRGSGPLPVEKLISIVSNTSIPFLEKTPFLHRLLETPQGQSFVLTELITSRAAPVRNWVVNELPETFTPELMAIVVHEMHRYSPEVNKRFLASLESSTAEELAAAIEYDTQLHGEPLYIAWCSLPNFEMNLLAWGEGRCDVLSKAILLLRAAAVTKDDLPIIVDIDIHHLHRTFSMELFEETYSRLKRLPGREADLQELTQMLSSRLRQFEPTMQYPSDFFRSLRLINREGLNALIPVALEHIAFLLGCMSSESESPAGSPGGLTHATQGMLKLKPDVWKKFANELLPELEQISLSLFGSKVISIGKSLLDRSELTVEQRQSYRRLVAGALLARKDFRAVTALLGDVSVTSPADDRRILIEALIDDRDQWPQAIHLLRSLPELQEIGSYSALLQLLSSTTSQVSERGFRFHMTNMFLLGLVSHNLREWNGDLTAWSYVESRNAPVQDILEFAQLRQNSDPRILQRELTMLFTALRTAEPREIKRFVRPAIVSCEALLEALAGHALHRHVRHFHACLLALRGDVDPLRQLLANNELVSESSRKLAVYLALEQQDVHAALSSWAFDRDASVLQDVAVFAAESPEAHGEIISELLNELETNGLYKYDEYIILAIWRGILTGDIRTHWDRIVWLFPDAYRQKLCLGLSHYFARRSAEPGFVIEFTRVLRAGLSEVEIELWLDYSREFIQKFGGLPAQHQRLVDRTLTQVEIDHPESKTVVSSFRSALFPPSYLSRKALTQHFVSGQRDLDPSELRSHVLCLLSDEGCSLLVRDAYSDILAQPIDVSFSPDEHLELRNSIVAHYLDQYDPIALSAFIVNAEQSPIPNQEEMFAATLTTALRRTVKSGWALDLLDRLPHMEISLSLRKNWLIQLLGTDSISIGQRLGAAARWQLHSLRPDAEIRREAMRLYFTQKKNFEAYYCWRWLMEHRPDLIVNQKELAVIPLGLVAELTARSRLGDAKRLLLSIEYHRYRQTDAGRLLTAYLDSRLAELEPPGETREFQIRSVRRTLEHVLRSDNLRMIGEFIEHNVKSLETAGISVLGGIREWMQYHQNQRRLAKSLEQVLRPDPHFGWSEPARKIQQEMQRRCDPNWRNLEKAVEHARTEMSRVLKRGESRQQLLEKINRVESIAKELRQVEERKLNLQKSCGMADMSVTRLRRLAASLRDESALHESRGAIDVSFVYNEIIAKIEELISYD